MITQIIERACQRNQDGKSRYGTAMYSCHQDGLFVSYRPVQFRGGEALMLHCLEADEPGSGSWKRFWQSVLKVQPKLIDAGFLYVVIDCILEPRFEEHIAKTWELVKPMELPDPSTYMSTYCWKVE